MHETRAPWISTPKRHEYFMLDVEICLIALLIFSCFSYGWRPALLTAFSIIAAVGSELLGNALRHQRPTIFDGTAMVTGTVIALLMSPITPYWVPMMASAFAILVVKIPFGGAGRNVFNPAAAGVALVTQCFPAYVFTYPDATANGSLRLWEIPETIITKASPAADLAAGADATFSFSQVVWGELSGPIGAVAIFILIAAAAFLFIRRTASAWTVIPYVCVCTLIAIIFPRGTQGEMMHSIAAELCAGYLLFAGIFLLSDPVTSPKYPPAKVAYGLLAGILVMLLRHVGRFEEGAAFAVLLVNVIAAPLDRGCWYLVGYWRDRQSARKRGGAR